MYVYMYIISEKIITYDNLCYALFVSMCGEPKLRRQSAITRLQATITGTIFD